LKTLASILTENKFTTPVPEHTFKKAPVPVPSLVPVPVKKMTCNHVFAGTSKILIFLVHIYIIYLCRNMEGEKDSDAVWNKLMAWGDSLEQSTADPCDNGNKDEDVAMRILDEPDEDDVDEIQILTPLPPPAEHHSPTSADPKQVNTNFDGSDSTGQNGADPSPDPGLAPPVHTVPDPENMENEDEKSSNCSEVTYQSVNTSYSKHGIKIKGESYGEDETIFIEPEKPYMPSTYYQNKSARAASHCEMC
jgi:hypothetical protein